MRKLAWFAVFFSAAALFVFLFPESARVSLWPVPLVALIVFGSTFLLPASALPMVRILRVALLGFGIGCLYVLVWSQQTQKEVVPLLEKEQTVEVVVLEDSAEASFGIKTDIRIGHLRCTLFSDREKQLSAGQRIRVRAVFRSTLERTNSDYYLTLGVPLFAYSRETPEILGEAEAGWRFIPARIGTFLRDRIRAIFDERSAAFLLAVLTGDRSALRQDVWFSTMLRSSGVSHCVAISGMHLSFIVMFLYVLLGRGRLSSCVCIPVTLLFMAITGFSASVVRAGVMQIAVCGAKIGRKPYDSLTALGLALLLLVLLNPYCIRNAGLILSFASTLGILLFYPGIKEGLPQHPKKWNHHALGARLWRSVLDSLEISLASAIFTTPLNALFFRQISLLAPFTNLLILWAVSLCFSLGLLGILFSLLSLRAGVLFRLPIMLIVGYIRGVTGWIGSFPLASLYIRSPYLACWLFTSWTCMGICHFFPGMHHRTRTFMITAALGLVLFLGLSWLDPALDAYRFCALDVGQGQCLVLTGPKTTTIIDCGGSLSANAGDLAVEHLYAQGRFRIDHLILTHFHQDHVNGVPELLQRLSVDTLYCPRPAPEDSEAQELLSCAKELGTEVVYLEENMVWVNRDGLEMVIVPPLNQIRENESGLCIAAKAGEISLLCTGDAGMETEARLMERLRIENLAILVVGHHGSAGSASDALLEAAEPRIAVISVGRNSYVLPSPKTLERLHAHGMRIYRTDEQGDILITERQEGKLWGKLNWMLFARA